MPVPIHLAASGVITVSAYPSLVFLKTVAIYSDPVNGTANPKSIPGAEVDYTLMVTNSGAGPVDTNTLTIIDPIPDNTELFIGNHYGGLPFVFAEAAPADWPAVLPHSTILATAWISLL